MCWYTAFFFLLLTQRMVPKSSPSETAVNVCALYFRIKALETFSCCHQWKSVKWKGSFHWNLFQRSACGYEELCRVQVFICTPSTVFPLRCVCGTWGGGRWKLCFVLSVLSGPVSSLRAWSVVLVICSGVVEQIRALQQSCVSVTGAGWERGRVVASGVGL